MATNSIEMLQEWYIAQCDGDWTALQPEGLSTLATSSKHSWARPRLRRSWEQRRRV